MTLGVTACTTENVHNTGLFVGKVVGVDKKFSGDLNLPVVEGWFFSIRKDKRVRDLGAVWGCLIVSIIERCYPQGWSLPAQQGLSGPGEGHSDGRFQPALQP